MKRRRAILLLLILSLGLLCGCRAWDRSWDYRVTTEATRFGAYWGAIPGVFILAVLIPFGAPIDVIPDDPEFERAATQPSTWTATAGGFLVGLPFALMILPYEWLTEPDPEAFAEGSEPSPEEETSAKEKQARKPEQ